MCHNRFTVQIDLFKYKRLEGVPIKILGRATLKLFGPVQTDATSLANNSQLYWMLHVASVCTPCCMLVDAQR